MKKLFIFLLALTFTSSCWSGVNLNGDADYIDIGTMGNFGTGLDTNYFIFSCWFKTSNTTDEICLLGILNDGFNTYFEFTLNVDDDGVGIVAHNIHVRRRDEDALNLKGAVEPGSGVCDNIEHHLVISVNNTGTNVWLDKVAQTFDQHESTNPDNIANFEYSVTIGGRNSRGIIDKLFPGTINEVAIWSSSTEPTQVEIDNLYSKIKTIPLQIKTTDLTGGYWPLDGHPAGTSINGLTFKDLSVNGNDGTGVDADSDSVTTGESVLSYPPGIISQ